MKGIFHICLCCILSLLASDAVAQSGTNSVNPATPQLKAVQKPKIKKPKPLRTELSGGLRLNTDGWSIFVDKGWVRSEERYSDLFYNVRLLQVEFTEKKHPQEIKRTNTIGAYTEDKPRPFIYGKINNFYALKIGYGGRKMLAGKPEPTNISLHWVYVGGLSIGFQKPYYIDAYVVQDQNGTIVQETIKYTDSTKQPFLTKSQIIGSAGFSKGIGEVKIIPGIHAKTGLHFDFAATKHGKVAIETGVGFEYYTSKVELMANKEAKPMFVNVYASIQFGKRW